MFRFTLLLQGKDEPCARALHVLSLAPNALILAWG